MIFDSDVLSKDAPNWAIEELQLRLAGFRGTLWDGVYGSGTESQIIAFQKDYMKKDNPSGICDQETLQALDRFAKEFPVNFQSSVLLCPCQQGACKGFGQNQFDQQYLPGQDHTERSHMKEYPGVHKAILHVFRAVQFYAREAGFGQATINSGYRCWNYNKQKKRTTTNHLGKALDVDFPLQAGQSKADDVRHCDAVRAILVEKSNFQIGWSSKNVKALEPSNIAPTWVHMDVRCYESKYLEDRFFVKTLEELDSIKLCKTQPQESEEPMSELEKQSKLSG